MNAIADTSIIIALLTDGLRFILKLLPEIKANYNLPILNLDLSRDEIVELIRETRMR
jgi:hypothetical protein